MTRSFEGLQENSCPQRYSSRALSDERSIARIAVHVHQQPKLPVHLGAFVSMTSVLAAVLDTD